MAHGRRARTISLRRLTSDEIAFRAVDDAPVDHPKKRSDCEYGQRPCPYVSCAFHLYVDVSAHAIKFNFPGTEVTQLRKSCALDVADKGGATLDEVADALNITKERVRQIEARAFKKLGPQVKHLRDAMDISMVCVHALCGKLRLNDPTVAGGRIYCQRHQKKFAAKLRRSRVA